jgi:hypothetical protein
MSCIPSTPIVDNLLSDSTTDYGWQALGTGLITTALSQYYPLLAGVVAFANAAQTSRQHIITEQLEFEETASSSANIKKTPLLVLLYSGAAPTTPTSGAVYNGSTVNLVGVVEIATGDYKRVSDTVWVARVKPEIHWRTTNGVLASTLNAVVLSNSASAVTYAASAAGRLRVTNRMGTAL